MDPWQNLVNQFNQRMIRVEGLTDQHRHLYAQIYSELAALKVMVATLQKGQNARKDNTKDRWKYALGLTLSGYAIWVIDPEFFKALMPFLKSLLS